MLHLKHPPNILLRSVLFFSSYTNDLESKRIQLKQTSHMGKCSTKKYWCETKPPIHSVLPGNSAGDLFLDGDLWRCSRWSDPSNWEIKMVTLRITWYPWTPKPTKIKVLDPQYTGEITPKNEGNRGFPMVVHSSTCPRRCFCSRPYAIRTKNMKKHPPSPPS